MRIRSVDWDLVKLQDGFLFKGDVEEFGSPSPSIPSIIFSGKVACTALPLRMS